LLPIKNVPPSIQREFGYNLLGRFGSSLAYDTRNSVRLPDKGQRTELTGEVVTADRPHSSGWRRGSSGTSPTPRTRSRSPT
jgi:hypothetical protein